MVDGQHSHRASRKVRNWEGVVTYPGPSAPHDSGQGESQLTALLSGPASFPQIIFLQTRPRLPHIAALLSSCIDGYIYAWSIHGSGGLLGKFPVDFKNQGDVGVGAMATDEKDLILVTGDCKGHIKVRKNWFEIEGLAPAKLWPHLCCMWRQPSPYFPGYWFHSYNSGQ